MPMGRLDRAGQCLDMGGRMGVAPSYPPPKNFSFSLYFGSTMRVCEGFCVKNGLHLTFASNRLISASNIANLHLTFASNNGNLHLT